MSYKTRIECDGCTKEQPKDCPEGLLFKPVIVGVGHGGTLSASCEVYHYCSLDCAERGMVRLVREKMMERDRG